MQPGAREQESANDLTAVDYGLAEYPAADAFTKEGQCLKVKAGTAAYHQGDQAKSIYQVISGVVRLCKTTAEGQRQILGFAFAGQWLGVGGPAVITHSAEAITDAKLRVYPRDRLWRMMDDDQKVASFFLRVASHNLTSAEQQSIMLRAGTSLKKLAEFLLFIQQQAGCESVTDHMLQLPMNRTDIADYLNMSMETVSRKFSQLRRMQIIDLPSPNKVVILDRKRLASIVDGTGSQDC